MTQTAQPNKRHIVLVDHALQRSLLVALVVLEVLVVASAIAVLYQALANIADENLYRIHFSGELSVLSLLLREGLHVLAGMLAVNLLALIVADRVWAFYVNRILRNLDRLMSASEQLDFRSQAPSAFDHAVLAQAVAWRVNAAAQLAQARLALHELPAQLPEPAQRDALAATLARPRQG
ncbi:hypothetical protein [Rhodoferax sp.]|uniref:hypothetical protein n=1 Tax=Rhodoferax sp. TaxID=50421 RepID=UPI0027644DA5|nr:hypothetical protein [Rhodoferax sp.]